MTYEITRDLARYRLNTRSWMRAHRTMLQLRTVVQPEWMRRMVPKDMTGSRA